MRNRGSAAAIGRGGLLLFLAEGRREKKDEEAGLHLKSDNPTHKGGEKRKIQQNLGV